jgi:hypothetical protein
MTRAITRVVVCAALAYKDILILGPRHFDATMHAQMANSRCAMMVKGGAWEQGFIDQHGVFMDRKEALLVAQAAGQIGLYRPKNPGEWLCSEDLY